MKKLSLEIEALAVQTFETGAAAADARGTVKAHVATGSGSTCVYHCTFAGDTCDNCPLTFACPKTYRC